MICNDLLDQVIRFAMIDREANVNPFHSKPAGSIGWRIRGIEDDTGSTAKLVIQVLDKPIDQPHPLAMQPIWIGTRAGAAAGATTL